MLVTTPLPPPPPEPTTDGGGKPENGSSSKQPPSLDPSSAGGEKAERQTVSFERPQRENERLSRTETPSFKSATLGCERSPSGREGERRTVSFERAQRENEQSSRTETQSYKSATLGRERSPSGREGERRTVSFERGERSPRLEAPSPSSTAMSKSKSATLGRDPSPARREEREGDGERRTVSLERRRERSPQPERDVTTLDPKTIESIEKFQRLKERSKARESESYVQPLVARERSPDPGSRRRSDGVQLTATQRRLNSRALETSLPSGIREGDKSPKPDSSHDGSSRQKTTPSPASVSSGERNSSPADASRGSPAAALTPPAARKSTSPDLRRKVDCSDRSASPGHHPPQQKTGLASCESLPQNANSVPPLRKEIEKDGTGERLNETVEEKAKVVEEGEEETEQEKMERAKREREKAREERKKARKEEERRREEGQKRQREEAERRMEEERKRMEQDREKAKEVRRRERERKLAQRNNSSSSGSSESLIKTIDRNRWAWSVEARTSETTTQSNGVKPHPPGSESNEAPKEEAAPEKRDTKKTPPQPTKKEERKTSASEFFQFGMDFSRNSVKRRENSEKPSTEVPRTSSPVKSPRIEAVSGATGKRSPAAENPPRSDSPVVIISPPPTPEMGENHSEAAPVRYRRECSPIAEQKRFMGNRRMTPVISIDALDAILRGEVEEDSDVLQYATQLNPYHHRQLESCPEENEPQISPPRTKSPSPLLKERKSNGSSSNGQQFLAERREGVLPSAIRDPNRSISPEKRRVTLLTGKDRTQSMDLDRTLSPEGSDRSTASLTPSPSPDFSKSFDASRSHAISKPAGVSRLTVSGSYSSLSRSTPDLSDILGGAGKKGKDGRKAERSSSRRLGMGRSRMDSYVTSTEHSSSYYHSPASPHLMKSGRHATVTSRLLSGGKGFLSKWNESKNVRQNHKVSS